MVFNSLPFLVFLPLFCLIYFLTRGTTRLVVCLLGSYLFYGWWDWRFLSLIMFSTGLDYYVGQKLHTTNDETQRRRWMWLSVVANLSLLGVFKYFNFFIDSFMSVASALGLGSRPEPFNIILPVGISFFTFQTMSYTIDVYRRKCATEHSLLRFATFVAFFPQLVAGPIVRAGIFLPQLRRDHDFRWQRMTEGLLMVLWGYVLKVVIADSLALVVDLRFADPALNNGLSTMIGVVFYAFQIYCDFNGYSLIAIGVAWMLGFDFGRNFNRPYFATSFSDFWRRWHISLSTWLRDYLYIPLGGNRLGVGRTYVNLMTVMLLGGLWHGASWKFVVWGALHGCFLVVERVIEGVRTSTAMERSSNSLFGRVASILVVFTLTCVAWVFFRADSLSDALAMLQTMATGDYAVSQIGQKFHVAKGLGLIGMLVLLEAVSFRVPPKALFAARPVLVPFALAAMLWAIALLGTFGRETFIYFQF